MTRTIRPVALALLVAGAAALSVPAQAQVTFVPEQKEGELATNRLGGTTVLNGQGEIIGRVEDVILDSRGQAVAVALGVGGFLRVGQRIVAVPYNAIKIGPIHNGRRLVVLDVTREQLAAAPPYKATEPGKFDRARQTAESWAKSVRDKAVELANQAREAAQKAMPKEAPKEAPKNAPAPKDAPKEAPKDAAPAKK
jgi:sporulation protein YlmC with PRC-barrel domain